MKLAKILNCERPELNCKSSPHRSFYTHSGFAQLVQINVFLHVQNSSKIVSFLILLDIEKKII